MNLEIATAKSGAPCLRYGGEHLLDDPTDPMAEAELLVAGAVPPDAKEVVLFGAGLGYRVRWLIAAGIEPLVYEPCPEVVQMAESREPGIFEGARIFHELPPLVATLVGRSRAGEKMVLVAPPAYVRAFPEAHAALARSMREADGMRQVRKNTARERYRPQIEGALANLPRLGAHPLTARLGRPLAGKPAFLVAAGPSLDRNVHLLREARARGAVFAVSTAGPVIAHRETRIDALFSIETIDQTEWLAAGAAWADVLAIDLSANPKNVGVDAPRRTFFLPDHPAFGGLASALGEPALPYGASVATAAAALAHRLGADPIVLVGQDLAYTDGRVYATGTGREAFRATVRGGVLVVEHDERFEEAFRSHGLSVPTKAKPAVEVDAWGGRGVVATTHDLVMSGRWFESFAQRLAGQRRLVNATEGGMHLVGFEDRPLEQVLAELAPLPELEGSERRPVARAVDDAERLDGSEVAEVRGELHRSARQLGNLARRVLSTKHPKKRRRAENDLRTLSKTAPLVDTYAAPDLSRILDDPALAGRDAERAQAVFTAVARSADRVAALVTRSEATRR